MTTLEIFAANMAYLRNQKGWTQEEAATKIWVNKKRYAAWEEGRALPQAAVLVDICKAYGQKDLLKLLIERIEKP